MVKTTSVHLYNFLLAFSFSTLRMSSTLQLPAIFGTSLHQVPRGEGAGDEERPKTKKKGKIESWGKEIFLPALLELI